MGGLSTEHRHELEVESGIPPDVIADRGYVTITQKAELERRGFGRSQRIVPALLIPLWTVNGELGGYQCKPKFPRLKKGKPLKYETPSGAGVVLDVPPRVRHMIRDPKIPLYVTEGVKKVDRAAAAGLCCIGLLGVWNWRGRNDDGGLTALADWESIALKGRTAIIAFDSDVLTKKPVLNAMRRLRGFLESRGATVRICVLQPGPSGEKTGLDDFFVRGGTVAGLQLCVQDELPGGGGDEPEAEYEQRDDGIYWRKPTRDGAELVRLTNFQATFTREIRRDDGVEVQGVIELEVVLNEKPATVTIPVDGLASPDWPLRYLGISAQVMPTVTPQRLRYAIQSLSDPDHVTEYVHTGWRRVGDDYYFLHGGVTGPIGPQGPLPTVEVDLPDQLRRCTLPAPPEDQGRADAVTSMLEVIELADPEITFPLMLAVVRAVIGEADFSLFVEGPTGTRKTALAAVFQAFFGSSFDARSLPANWSSTPNAIEETMFVAKDVVVVVDDYVPATQGDRTALDAKADRVFRGSANGAGRQRLRRDGTPRPQRPSRCVPIATGEVLPQGHSVLARLLVLELQRGSINLLRLTAAQEDARAGRLSSAMSALLQWLSPRLDAERKRLHSNASERRAALQGRGWHTRTAHTIAELLATLQVFVDFLEYAGAISPRERDGVIEDGTNALLEVGDAQARLQRDADPVDLFFELLSSALASGRAHLACSKAGEGPPNAIEQHAGWQRDPVSAHWSPRGQMIGWASEVAGVYLIPNATESVLQQYARDRGVVLVAGPSLRKRLRDRGRLASTEERGGATRLTVRRTIGKVRHDVLHLHTSSLWDLATAEEVAQLAQSGGSGDLATGCGGPVPKREWPTCEASGPDGDPEGGGHA